MVKTMTKYSFSEMLIKRIQSLLLEIISFKFLIFVLILLSTRDLTYISDIINAVAGATVLSYKAYKETYKDKKE